MRLFLFFVAATIICLATACGPDDDIMSPRPEPVGPNCRPSAFLPDPGLLPARMVVIDSRDDTLKAVNIFYDTNNRLAEKRFDNGDAFTYFYGDDFNRIPDSILEVRVTEGIRKITYDFSEDCLPTVERNLLLLENTTSRILLGRTDFAHENDQLVSSMGQLFIGGDELTATYFYNDVTGLVDSVIREADDDNLSGPVLEKYFYTYTEIDNPYVVPEEMSYENLFAYRLNSGAKMVSSFTRDITSRIQTGVFRSEYAYELDGEGRIRTVTASPGGTKYYFFYD